jgi:hypothetical protein
VLPHIGLRYKTQDEIGKNSLSKLSNLFAIVGKSPETYSNFIRTPYSLRNTAAGRLAGLESASIGKLHVAPYFKLY